MTQRPLAPSAADPSPAPRAAAPLAAPVDLRVEHAEPGAVGLGSTRPRLSWVVPTAPEGWAQAAYEVEGTITRADGGTEPVHAAVESERSVLVDWPARELGAREALEVRVRVRGSDDAWSPWSRPVTAALGLLAPSDWSAVLVGPPETDGADRTTDGTTAADRRPVLLRRTFVAPTGTRRALLYVTAHGVTELELNGRRVGADVLAPGWTSYRHRLRVLAYDVTDLLVEGENVLGAWLADGWYRGHLGFQGGHWDVFGADLGLLAQLEVVTGHGRSVAVATDEAWRWTPAPTLSAQLYEGEHHDARLEQPGWSAPGFDDAAWPAVTALPLDLDVLTTADAPPVRCTDELAPVHVEEREPGRWLLDFGQNHAGRLRVRVAGPAGTTVTLRHAEVLEDGELCVRPLRAAVSVDSLVLGDEAVTEWEPRFTMHGYRYAEVSGWPGPLAPGDVVSRVHHSVMRRTGAFSSSDPALDRLHENAVWSMRSNFLDVPTDCPQRDERMGWTGDIAVFAPTAATLYDCTGMLADWLRSVSAEQAQYGTVPWYVPYVPGEEWDPTVPGALWGDAAVMVPWALFQASDDRAVLARQYPSARAWVDQVTALAGPDRVWDTGFQLGDWLDPTAPPDDPTLAVTDRYLVATACFARSARLLAATAEVLGEADDARRYGLLADEVRAAFAARYLTDPPPAGADSQTAYALALTWDLVPDEAARRRVADRLAALVAAGGFTVATGFAGTPVLCDALSSSGHLDTAYRVLLGRECPSWLYAVDMGATTTWERWDSLLPDGSVNPGDMTSFNHYAFGSVVDWVHRVVAGLALDEPGGRRLRVAPRPGGGLTHARSERRTPYGDASVAWRLEGDLVEVEAVVPVGATALVDLGSRRQEVGHGTHRFTVPLAELVGTGNPSVLNV
ncbi:family 78 glycoside hydrolase catalytic domain [Cellulomonas sp. DKR-3]|uniref:alpha-L-rhamnosidase n=1 Tax=Cellulomonas fulva TaxID=2835530 RepID=A0ABS5TXF3_9CELL|nr:alpha-L-rhamnosidase [Cellulomonas fulva]MBT0993839.1 family 78 glycoside hydrolase catalytic domain [Cellulomonas fulva]